MRRSIRISSASGSIRSFNLFTNLPTDATTAANTGTPFASFLLGQVQQFSIDLQQARIRNRAHVEEYFIQDSWRVSDRVTVNAGLRYTLNFPSYEEDNQVAVFNLQTEQLEYAGRDGNPDAARRLHKLDLGPRLGIVGRLTDRTVARVGYGRIFIEPCIGCADEDRKNSAAARAADQCLAGRQLAEAASHRACNSYKSARGRVGNPRGVELPSPSTTALPDQRRRARLIRAANRRASLSGRSAATPSGTRRPAFHGGPRAARSD